MPIDNRSLEAIQEEALRWVLRLQDEGLTEQERDEFFQWVLSDPRHGREFRAHNAVVVMGSQLTVEAVGKPNNVIALPKRTGPQPAVRRRSLRQRRWLSASAAAVLLVGVAVSGWLLLPPPAEPVKTPHNLYVTDIGQNLTVPLEDGSRIHLNTRTRLQWLGSARERRVALLEGEAMFEIVEDPSRPFRVVMAESEVQVLGTRFNVYRKSDGEVVVSVIDGKVKVLKSNADDLQAAVPRWERELRANEELAYRGGEVLNDVHVIVGLDAVKWREDVLEVKDEPLPRVVAELSRYSKRPIVISDPRLERMRLGGTLSTRELRVSLGRIERLIPIVVKENAEGFTLDYRTTETAVAQEERR